MPWFEDTEHLWKFPEMVKWEPTDITNLNSSNWNNQINATSPFITDVSLDDTNKVLYLCGGRDLTSDTSEPGSTVRITYSGNFQSPTLTHENNSYGGQMIARVGTRIFVNDYGTVVELDGTNMSFVRTITTQGLANNLQMVEGGGFLWIIKSDNATIIRFNLTTNTSTEYALGDSPQNTFSQRQVLYSSSTSKLYVLLTDAGVSKMTKMNVDATGKSTTTISICNMMRQRTADNNFDLVYATLNAPRLKYVGVYDISTDTVTGTAKTSGLLRGIYNSGSWHNNVRMDRYIDFDGDGNCYFSLETGSPDWLYKHSFGYTNLHTADASLKLFVSVGSTADIREQLRVEVGSGPEDGVIYGGDGTFTLAIGDEPPSEFSIINNWEAGFPQLRISDGFLIKSPDRNATLWFVDPLTGTNRRQFIRLNAVSLDMQGAVEI